MISARKESLRQALTDMLHHQQGNHGWAVFHEGLAELAASERSSALDEVLSAVWRERPYISDAHAISLLGASVRHLLLQDGAPAGVFDAGTPLKERVTVLADLLHERHAAVVRLMDGRSNSYTGARRFLLPQLVIGAFAEARGLDRVRLLDLGTSIGLLPRQLNNEVVFDRFAGDLRWHPAAPPFRHIPLEFVCGVDRPPLPTLEWVRTCHGPSDYYEQRFEEVLWSLDRSKEAEERVLLRPLDLLDSAALAGLLKAFRINVVTCNFVLYQYAEEVRRRLVETVMGALAVPGMLLVMDPSHGLTRMGCTVHAYRDGGTEPLHIADVSDAHFVGDVHVRAGFGALTG
ncbi:hypothetical protein JK359_18355 [Streptomyces actinomycinicus]|uniref:Uncharacterized protein n=1 Tax=Streptomyces actinomycinicus TaxID=1695166 RepID=A0A937JPX0_9ACTN|nr:hypothetical protein [Streptomyces actinomycinicus]MBL1083907.1 hypothetical protein [Streptomyces actinomycinicus]